MAKVGYSITINRDICEACTEFHIDFLFVHSTIGILLDSNP